MNKKSFVFPRRILKLSPSQFELYQHGEVDIVSPSGDTLCTVGVGVDRARTEVETMRLHDTVCLVESLVRQNNGQLELSDYALAGLSEMLSQSAELLR